MILVSDPGQLNRRATFLCKRHGPDARGGFSEAEVSSFTVWAKLEVVGSAQFWGSTQINQKTTHRLWVRRIAGKTRPEDFTRINDVVVDGMRFRIRRVTDGNDARRFTLLEIEQLGVADGISSNQRS